MNYIIYALILGGICFLLYRWARYELAKTDKLISRINAENGVSLRVDFLGTISRGILFDQAAKKFCLFRGRNRHEVLDFSYILAWRFESGKHNQIVLETNDLDRPLIHIPILTARDGKQWMAKLSILFGHT